MEKIEWLLVRILLPVLIGWIFFKIVEYLTLKVSISDYEYSGVDLLGYDAKVIWFFSENNRNINGIKYSNNKYYFKVITQFNNKKISTIVIFNKKEMDLKTRFKLIKWLIFETIKNKIEPYIFTDSLYLNIENFNKNFISLK